jgi:hypothetical protein
VILFSAYLAGFTLGGMIPLAYQTVGRSTPVTTCLKSNNFFRCEDGVFLDKQKIMNIKFISVILPKPEGREPFIGKGKTLHSAQISRSTIHLHSPINTYKISLSQNTADG